MSRRSPEYMSPEDGSRRPSIDASARGDYLPGIEDWHPGEDLQNPREVDRPRGRKAYQSTLDYFESVENDEFFANYDPKAKSGITIADMEKMSEKELLDLANRYDKINQGYERHRQQKQQGAERHRQQKQQAAERPRGSRYERNGEESNPLLDREIIRRSEDARRRVEENPRARKSLKNKIAIGVAGGLAALALIFGVKNKLDSHEGPKDTSRVKATEASHETETEAMYKTALRGQGVTTELDDMTESETSTTRRGRTTRSTESITKVATESETMPTAEASTKGAKPTYASYDAWESTTHQSDDTSANPGASTNSGQATTMESLGQSSTAQSGRSESDTSAQGESVSSREATNEKIGSLWNGTHVDLTEYTSTEKEKANAFGLDASYAYGDRDATANVITSIASNGPAFLANHCNLLTMAEKEELGISGMNAEEINKYILTSPNGGAIQQNIENKLAEVLSDYENTAIDFHTANPGEVQYSYYAYTLDRDGQNIPASTATIENGIHLDQDEVTRQGGERQASIWRYVDGDWYNMYNINLNCGGQAYHTVAVPDIPMVAEVETPAPTYVAQPETSAPETEAPAPSVSTPDIQPETQAPESEKIDIPYHNIETGPDLLQNYDVEAPRITIDDEELAPDINLDEEIFAPILTIDPAEEASEPVADIELPTVETEAAVELPSVETEAHEDLPAPQTEAPQTEAPQTEAPQTEAPQTEAPQTEAPQTEAPQTEAPETETAVELPSVETEAAVELPSVETEAPQTEAPETEALQTEWGKTGDPHAGNAVEYSEQVNPESVVTAEQNEKTNEGNQGYVDDGGATPGQASPEPTEVGGFTESGIIAEGATAEEGERLTGGEDQSAPESASEGAVAGESVAEQTIEEVNQTSMEDLVAAEAAGNAAQAEQVENNVIAGEDNYTDAEEVQNVLNGDF